VELGLRYLEGGRMAQRHTHNRLETHGAMVWRPLTGRGVAWRGMAFHFSSTITKYSTLSPCVKTGRYYYYQELPAMY